MYKFDDKCKKHNLPLVEFCDKEHESEMDLEYYNDVYWNESSTIFVAHELNWDKGARCDKGCIYTNTVIINVSNISNLMAKALTKECEMMPKIGMSSKLK